MFEGGTGPGSVEHPGPLVPSVPVAAEVPVGLGFRLRSHRRDHGGCDANSARYDNRKK